MAKAKAPKPPDWETDPEAKPVRLYCIGRRLTTDNKLMPFYVETPSEEHGVGISKLAAGWPGAVITLYMKGESYWPSSSSYVERYTGPEVEGWQIEDRAAFGRDELRKGEARAKREGTDLGTITLGGLRERMHTLPYNSQQALIAQVLLYLARRTG